MTTLTTQREVIVRERTPLVVGITGLTLAAADGSVLPATDPGTHVDLWLPGGLVRQYSVIERTPDGAYRIAVLHEPASRGGSAYLCEQIRMGDRLALSGPRNHFKLDEHADAYVLLAGGIGITPILPMARRLAELNKPFTLHYLARSRERAALLDALAEPALAGRVQLHLSEEHGSVDLAALLSTPRPGAHLYVCGPARLIDGVLAAAQGWPTGTLHFERFASVEAPASTAAFEVELARSARVLTVAPEQSILQSLRGAGVCIESICGKGVCGSCAVPLLAGEAEHRDSVQTDAEKALQQTVYVCVSRAKTARLVLDL